MDWIKALQQYQNQIAQNNPILNTVQKTVQPVGNAIQDFAKGAFADTPGQGLQSTSPYEQFGDTVANSTPGVDIVMPTAHAGIQAAGHVSPFLHGAAPMIMGALSKAPDFFKEAQSAPKLLGDGRFQNNYPDVTTKTLRALEGRTTVSPGFVQSTMNQIAGKEGLAQPERDLITSVLNGYQGQPKIPVREFADRVHSQLMPLTPKSYGSKWEDYSLGSRSLSNPDSYEAVVYDSPHEVSTGQSHFSSPNYFGHARVEKNPGELVPPPQEAIDKYVAGKTQNYVEKPIPENPGYYRVYDKTTNEPVSASYTTPGEAMQRILSYLPSNAARDLGHHGPATHSVQEIQSDLFQRGRYKDELNNGGVTVEQAQRLHDEALKELQVAQQNKVDYPKLADAASQGKLDDLLKTPGHDGLSYQDLVNTIKERTGVGDYAADQLAKGIDQHLDPQVIRHALEQAGQKVNAEEYQSTLNHHQSLYDSAKTRLENAKNYTPDKKAQDLESYKNDAWWKRLVRERIAHSAREGAGDMKFPTGDTAAKIEGYVNPDNESEGPFDPGEYNIGDTVDHNWDGNTHVVLGTGDNELLTVPSEHYQGSFDYSDFLNDEANHYIDDRESYANDLARHFDNEPKALFEKHQAKGKLSDSEILDKVEKKHPGTLDDAARSLAEENYGNVPWTIARNLEDQGLYTSAVSDGDTIHVSDQQPEWNSMQDDSVDPNGFPEDIRGELGSDQQRVYDFYDKDIRKYLQKIRGQDVKEVQDDYGNSWLHFPLKEKDKGPVDAWMMIPPVALGALTANQMAGQQQKQQ